MLDLGITLLYSGRSELLGLFSLSSEVNHFTIQLIAFTQLIVVTFELIVWQVYIIIDKLRTANSSILLATVSIRH